MTQYMTKPLAGTQIDWTNPLTRDLVGCWLFNEGAGIRAIDLSGNNNTGTLTNMAVNSSTSGWSGSPIGTSLNFDGVNDFVDCVNRPSLNIAGAVSMEAWIKPNITATRYILGKGITGAVAVYNYLLFTGSTYGIGAGFGNGVDYRYAIGGSALSSSSKLTHLIGIIISNTNIQLYINGNIVSSSYSGTATTKALNSSHLDIGFGDVASNQFNGNIALARIWNRALSTQEVQQLYVNPYSMFRFAPSKLLWRD